MKKLLIVWGNWGPYHLARFRAFHEAGKSQGFDVVGLEMFRSSGHYAWNAVDEHPALRRLDLSGVETDLKPWGLMTKLIPFLWKLRPDVIFVPSYWHWSLFLNYVGRMMGAKIVMMNESHAATEKARGLKRRIKKTIVRDFHAGFVGGTPHRRHFANLGLDPAKIFRGYDAVDDAHFTARSAEVRESADSFRAQLDLPEHYFLNLGRMVAKKNLPQLVRAFATLRNRRPDLPHDLVLVGSGEEESALRDLANELGLTIANHLQSAESTVQIPEPELVAAGSTEPARSLHSERELSSRRPTVHFYGFRQIDENPIFYALATAFILPSTTEEWGLVVNEAMASNLPVIVSNRLGCAEDLVEDGINGYTFNPDSHEELADALEKVADSKTATDFGKNSLARIQHWGCDRFATGALKAAQAALTKPSK